MKDFFSSNIVHFSDIFFKQLITSQKWPNDIHVHVDLVASIFLERCSTRKTKNEKQCGGLSSGCQG